MKIIISIIIIIISHCLHAQVKIRNVNFKQLDDKIIVNYDLSGEGMYSVELYYTKNDGKKWHGPLEDISGDIDEVKEGTGKTIKYDLTKNKNRLIGENIKFKVQLLSRGTFTDPRDGIKYKWVKIGDQIWMAENLKAKKYSDGTPIRLVQSNQSSHPTIARFRYKHKRSYAAKYGELYTWPAATRGKKSKSNPSNVQGICPDGWHIPSKNEWEQLAEFISKDKGPYLKNGDIRLYVGKHLKSEKVWSNNYSWLNEYKGTDDYDFEGLPGGCHTSEGKFIQEGDYAYWWSTTYWHYGNFAIYAALSYSNINFYTNYYTHCRDAFSVRCVKD
jgi:uncharacterized protein (TIGR02145 family)